MGASTVTGAGQVIRHIDADAVGEAVEGAKTGAKAGAEAGLEVPRAALADVRAGLGDRATAVRDAARRGLHNARGVEEVEGVVIDKRTSAADRGIIERALRDARGTSAPKVADPAQMSLQFPNAATAPVANGSGVTAAAEEAAGAAKVANSARVVEGVAGEVEAASRLGRAIPVIGTLLLVGGGVAEAVIDKNHWRGASAGAGSIAGAVAGTAIGATAGGVVFGAIGGALGSIIPVAGTAAGAAAGVAIGHWVGGAIGGWFGAKYGAQIGRGAYNLFHPSDAVAATTDGASPQTATAPAAAAVVTPVAFNSQQGLVARVQALNGKPGTIVGMDEGLQGGPSQAVKELQARILASRGGADLMLAALHSHYPGASDAKIQAMLVDGKMGPAMRDVIAQMRSNEKLSADGGVDFALLKRISDATPRAATEETKAA